MAHIVYNQHINNLSSGVQYVFFVSHIKAMRWRLRNGDTQSLA